MLAVWSWKGSCRNCDRSGICLHASWKWWGESICFLGRDSSFLVQIMLSHWYSVSVSLCKSNFVLEKETKNNTYLPFVVSEGDIWKQGHCLATAVGARLGRLWHHESWKQKDNESGNWMMSSQCWGHTTSGLLLCGNHSSLTVPASWQGEGIFL